MDALTKRMDHHEEITTKALLEVKDAVRQLTQTMEIQMTALVNALTGVNRIDLSTLNKIVGIFGAVIIGLVLVLVFALTGHIPSFLNTFSGAS